MRSRANFCLRLFCTANVFSFPSLPKRGVLSTHAFPFRKRTFSSFFPFSFAAISSTHATTTPEPEGPLLSSHCVVCVFKEANLDRLPINIFSRDPDRLRLRVLLATHNQPPLSLSFSLSLLPFCVLSFRERGEDRRFSLFFPFLSRTNVTGAPPLIRT